jgi:hypothetical protein
MNYLPGLASNHDLCLLSSQDYRHEPPVPNWTVHFHMVNKAGIDSVAECLSGMPETLDSIPCNSKKKKKG